LHEPGSGAPFYVSVFLSGRPASMLSGVASGATLAGPDPLPSTTRIVLLRVPDDGGPGLEASNNYLTLDPVALGDNLAAAGIAATQKAAAELCAFLRGGGAMVPMQVSQAAHAQLAGFCDAATAMP
jgi:hypothetical protein